MEKELQELKSRVENLEKLLKETIDAQSNKFPTVKDFFPNNPEIH